MTKKAGQIVTNNLQNGTVTGNPPAVIRQAQFVLCPHLFLTCQLHLLFLLERLVVYVKMSNVTDTQ
jgi:hypothetical protein